jgi:hypothetical protein
MVDVKPKHPKYCQYRGDILFTTRTFKKDKLFVEEYYKCNLSNEDVCPRRVEVEFKFLGAEEVCPIKKKREE